MFRAALASLLFIAGLSIVSSNAHADDKEKLGNFPIEAISVSVDPNDDDFEIIYSRMEETATAAVAFGLIGAAVNSGINDGEDADRAEKYEAAASEINLSDNLKAAIIKRLQKKEFPISGEDTPASHVLGVEIKEWGLRKISFDENEVSTFIRMRLTVKEGKKTLWEKWHKQSGKEELLLEDYSVEAFSENMEKLVEKTGRRIANEIIYR